MVLATLTLRTPRENAHHGGNHDEAHDAVHDHRNRGRRAARAHLDDRDLGAPTRRIVVSIPPARLLHWQQQVLVPAWSAPEIAAAAARQPHPSDGAPDRAWWQRQLVKNWIARGSRAIV